MPKTTIYLRDALSDAAKELDLPMSSICQSAIEAAVATSLPVLSMTASARKALQRAAYEADLLGDKTIGTEHLLLALVGDQGIAGQLIEELGMGPAIFESTRRRVHAATPSNRVIDRNGRVIGSLESSPDGKMRVVNEHGEPVELAHDPSLSR